MFASQETLTTGGGSATTLNSNFERRPQDTLDSRYSWVIMIASFLIQFITMGSALSIGILYSEWAEYFGSKFVVSWVASVSNCLVLSFGPMASTLSGRFGHRKVIICGSLLSTLGCCCSFLSFQSWHLILTYGILSGVGNSLMYIPAVTVVPFWFNKYRNTATGISVIGSTLGSVCYPPLYRILIEMYSWKGAMLILAGLYFNVCVLASLLCTPPSTTTSTAVLMNNEDQQYPSTPTIQTLRASIVEIETKKSSSRARAMNIFYLHGLHSRLRRRRESVRLSSNVCESLGISMNQLQQLHFLAADCHHLSPSPSFSTDDNKTIPSSSGHNTCHAKQDKCKYDSCIDTDIIFDPVFYVFVVCDICWNIGLFMMFSIAPDHAFTMGLSKTKSSLLVTMASICGCVGLLLIGPIDYFCQSNTMLLFAISTLGTVPFIAGLTFTSSFPTFALCMCGFGFWTGLQNGILPLVHGDYYEGKTEVAFGYISLADGIGGLIAPPLASHVYKITNSYAPAFSIGSIASATAGVIYLTIFLATKFSSFFKKFCLLDNGTVEDTTKNVTSSCSTHTNLTITYVEV